MTHPTRALQCASTLLSGLLIGLPASAQTLEAQRYVNGQGVEMLVSRSSMRPPGVQTEMAVPGTALPAAGAAGPAPAVAPARSESRITPAQQAVRDDERERVLTMELLNEGSQLETKRKALRSPRADTDLDTAQRAKLAAEVQRHEEDIRALTRELASLRPGRTTARPPVNTQAARVALRQ